jgi:hypothetical protein
MDDKVIEIIKDNKYHVKFPFEGKIIRFSFDENDRVNEGDVLAILKSRNSYIELEAEYGGTVSEICVQVDETLSKWDTVMIIDLDEDREVDIVDDLFGNADEFADAAGSKDYGIIYVFQQDILPNFIYDNPELFSLTVTAERERVIYELLKSTYELKGYEMPFSLEEFNIDLGLADEDKIIFIRIDWPIVEGPLLSCRTYVLIDSRTSKIQYFTSEKSFGNSLMLSSVIQSEDGLMRANYGSVEDDLEIEKMRLLEIFRD